MSSISFPTEQQASSANNGHFYPPFDGNSSFQMNPLSSHPPRTPRTSIISTTSTTHAYDSSIYVTKDEADKSVVVDEEDDDNEEEAKAVKGKVRREEVWREMFLTSNGRDKAFVRSHYEYSYRRSYFVCHGRN